METLSGRTSQFGLWSLLAAVLLFFALRIGGTTVSVAQVFAFPVVLLGLSFLVVQGKWRVPFWCLCVALIGALLSGRSFVVGGRGGPLTTAVSRLSGDELGTTSRIFREEIAAVVHMFTRGEVGAYHRPLMSNREALDFLSTSVEGSSVIRGDSNWLTVVTRSPWSEGVSALAPNSLAVQNIPLKFMTNIPAYGLSFRPREDSAIFLGTIFSGILKTRSSSLNTQDYSDGILMLLAAARRESPWTSFAHRGYAWFLVGNEYVREALSTEIYQPGAMECAFEAYSRVRSLARIDDNPDLAAAALNNTAVALFIHERQMGARRKHNVTSRLLLQWALGGKKLKNPYALPLVAPEVASENLRALKYLGNSVGSARQKKHRKKSGKRGGKRGKKYKQQLMLN